MEKILRRNSNLSLYNYNNMSDRLQEVTDGDMFLAYNGFNGRYELHSIKSFEHDKGNSVQASWETTLYLNEWLIRDIQANGKKFFKELESTREYLTNLHDQADKNREGLLSTRTLRGAEFVLGRKI